MAAIYRREKVAGKGWRYVRVNLGRGRRPADAPPYYIRFTLNGKRTWSEQFPSLEAAIKAAETLPDTLEATSKNITLGELTEQRNANRIPIRVAVATYLDHKRTKARKPVPQNRLR